MRTYLVTGGAGFIGSHLVDALLARGDHVRVLDDFSSGREENLPAPRVAASGEPVLEVIRGSISEPAACRTACEGVFGIFHEAAQVSVPRSVEDPVGSYAVNVDGTLRLLEAARSAGVQRVVFAASSAAYGDAETSPKHEEMLPAPLSPYASGKIAGEHLMRVYAESYGLRTVSLRYFNVFGPRQADDSPYSGVIAIFARALLEGRAARIYGNGEQTRDLTFVSNVVDANLRAMDRELPRGVVINVGSGRSISINQLYERMRTILGVDVEAVHAPARSGDVRHSLASIERARALLDYEPATTWEEGLEATTAWYRERLAPARSRR